MRQILVLAIMAVIFLGHASHAEVTLRRASQSHLTSEEAADRNRYERDAAYMNQVSDTISQQLFAKKDVDTSKSNANDNLQVKLIRVRR